MFRKNSLLTIVSIFGLLAGLMANQVSAQDDPPNDSISSDTAEGQITILSGGVFEATLCLEGDADTLIFTDAASNHVGESPIGTATIFICYADTQAQRPAFYVYMWADEWVTEGSTNVIPAERLRPQFIYNPVSQLPVSSGLGRIISHPGVHSGSLESVQNIDERRTATWEGGSLADPALVGSGQAGSGTVETWVQIDLELDATDIPAGTYTTTIYLDVTSDAP